MILSAPANTLVNGEDQMDLNPTTQSGAGITVDSLTVADHLEAPPAERLYAALAKVRNRNGEVNLAVPFTLAEVRRQHPSLSENSLTTSELEQLLGVLARSERVALVGWNGNGPVPTLAGKNTYWVRIF
jgi:hypothetical protein